MSAGHSESVRVRLRSVTSDEGQRQNIVTRFTAVPPRLRNTNRVC